MTYSRKCSGKHEGEEWYGITAPYCPPPACPPVRPMPCMDSCPPPPKAACPDVPMHKAAVWPRPVKACPPAHQSGVVCPKPPMKPIKPKCESILLQKIVSCEKRHIPQLCTRLELSNLSGRAPYRLLSVQQSGAQPWWTPVDNHAPDTRQHIRLSIPVCCQVCDSEGRTHSASAVVEVEVSYRAGGTDNGRNSLFIVPCVRLTGGDVCSDTGCFCVQLEVSVELYLLRPEPCTMHHPEPVCPELPLYPMPMQWQPYGEWPHNGWRGCN